MQERSGPDLCHNLAARRSARSLTRLYDRHLSGSGLSASQFSILSMIGDSDGITVAELAEMMVMERTTLVRALGPLTQGGLIERRPISGTAARSMHLTGHGTEKLRHATPLWKAAQAAFESDVGTVRATTLRDTILSLGFDRG